MLVAIAPVGATVPDIQPESLAVLVRGPARLAGGAMLLVGLLAAAGEFTHGTVLTARLAEPHPTRVLAAKSIALALVGLAVGALLVVVALGSGALLLSSKDVSVEPLRHGTPGVCGLVVVLMMLHAVLGVAIGSLLRNTAAAVGVVLMWAFRPIWCTGSRGAPSWRSSPGRQHRASSRRSRRRQPSWPATPP